MTIYNKQVDVVLISVECGFLPSLAALSLESYLNKAGIKAEILYPKISRDSLQTLIKKILEFKPSVVGLGGLFNDRFIIKKIIEALGPYRKNFKIVIGGNLVTPIPEYMVDKLSADIGVIGEGEIIFTKLVEKILEDKDFSGIGGLAFKEDDKVIFTGQGEYIKDLNELPSLNYEKIPMEYFVSVYKFYKNITRNNIFTPSSRLGAVFTGRGCLYECNFCYHFNTLRLLKIPAIILQMKELKERFSINMVRFLDDLTLVNKKRTLEFCQALLKEKLNLKYIVSAHFNCLDKEMVIALKESGCVQIALGLESGSQEVLNRINKGVKVEQIRQGLELLRKYRINWNGGIQVGQLGETKNDVKKTKNLFYPYISELATVSAAITTPYPGSPLYNYGLKSGLIKDNEDFFNKFRNLQGLTVNFSKMSNLRVNYLRLKLAFDFDFKKQKILRGILGVYLFLLRMLIMKIVVRIKGRRNRRVI
ncbi:MAG: radical SAM protein [Candidatus Omnitrophota bacterium]